MRAKFAFTFLLGAALVMSGCPSKNNEVAKPLKDISSDTSGATNPGSPGGAKLVPETQAGTTVLVALNDGSIAVTNSDAIPPGPAVFTVTNGTSNVHNLFIDGPGVQQAAGDDMPAGKTTSFQVNLKPGKYTLYCPILDHRTKGEQVELIVKPPTAPAPSSATTPPTGTDVTKT
jgi:hypothetical protein